MRCIDGVNTAASSGSPASLLLLLLLLLLLRHPTRTHGVDKGVVDGVSTRSFNLTHANDGLPTIAVNFGEVEAAENTGKLSSADLSLSLSLCPYACACVPRWQLPKPPHTPNQPTTVGCECGTEPPGGATAVMANGTPRVDVGAPASDASCLSLLPHNFQFSLLTVKHTGRDLERVSGLPLSPVMDKSNLVDCQVKFLSFAMLPLAELLISIIPALKSCFLIPTQKQLAHYRQKQKMVADSDEQPSEMEETVATSAKAAETNDDVEDDASEAALPVAILPISLNNCFAVSHSLTTEHHNSHPFPSDGCVDEEANLEGVSTSPALAIPNSMDFLSTHLHNSSGADRQGISASNPDRESAYHQPHSHHQRTSIVSSAGLIAAELAPPHRPLRRSLGELPWSTHALLLTPLEGGYCIAQPHQPPNTASRMSGEFCLSRTDESKTCP
ncbi:unnamed protein product [Mesocestoides corti]|uniref:Uncharacterized protein n=2 Tax=Mesocestoides corti TaxID=53468 RepID=A0A3P6HYY3_MESCO|nr:unnamed protein product [Mesocestoides corti]